MILVLPEVFRQSDKRHRAVFLGASHVTIWSGGCVLLSVVHAAIALRASPALTPTIANELFRRHGCFEGAGLRVDDVIVAGQTFNGAARFVGLSAPLAERRSMDDKPAPATQAQLVDALARALGNGALALLRVDNNGDKKGGDEFGDHTVLLTGLVATEGGALELEIADSATGRLERLSWPELRGTVRYSEHDVRRYAVRGVRPIRRR